MKIGIDIDNVIADLDEVFLDEFLKEDKKKRNKGIVNKNAQHMTEGMFDWSKEEIYDFVSENMDRMAIKFKLIEGAKYYIDKLHEEHEIYLVTHRTKNFFKKPKSVTKKWLKENKIYYDKLIFTKNKDKSKECIENKVDIMFDDEAINCRYILNAGIDCYLMKTRYNEKYSLDVPMVNDWKSLYELICKKNQFQK